MVRISQARVSNCLRTFRASFLQKYGLTTYVSSSKPAVFFGCYGTKPNSSDICAVRRHAALAVLVWGGNDAKGIGTGRYQSILTAKHVRHVAISRFISEDLARAGISHIHLPIFPSAPSRFKPAPLGPGVYVYSSHAQPEVYNEALVRRVIDLLPDVKFVRAYARANGHYKPSQMPQVYGRCFMGMRLTLHDGLANTAVELGLMGRKCIWNGWLPNAVPWHSPEGIVVTIRREQEKIPELDESALVRRVKKVTKYLRLPEWLDAEFYE